jgi:hypothetical protein
MSHIFDYDDSMKMQTVLLTGEDLAWFKELCSDMKAYGQTVSTVQIGIDEEGVKFKVNYGVWTPGKGKRE